MNKIRPFILAAVVVAAFLLAFGLFTLPKAQDASSEGFSSARVLNDIEVISREHHSVAQFEERSAVREYLVSRLEGMGADTVKQFRYDSLVGPQNKHVVYTFDAVDVLAEFAPADGTPDNFMMLVAHYDSRYSQPMPHRDTVWSYGAADDGYGVGVILETVSQLLKQRGKWHSGVKVLFTDAEEAGMMGMKAIWENNREEFDNVGFVINVEARGPWGPALLFETCPGNEKVMRLYADAAEYPFTYSLTTVVYSFMPNFTDFTIVKDEIPGMNFSTVADINHYHTDLDNFSNVSAKSIQHYGVQILPVARKYLTDDMYKGKDSLVSEDNTVNFTVPALGLVNMGKTAYMVMNIILLVIFVLLLAFEVLRGRIKFLRTLKCSGIILASALGVLLLGEFFAWVCAAAAGAAFKPFGIVVGVHFDNAAMIAMSVLLALLSVAFYILGRRRTARKVTSMRTNAVAGAVEKYAGSTLFGALALLSVLSAALLFTIGENMMFMIPLFCGVAAVLLYRVTTLKLWIPVAEVLILLHALSFLYALAMALTIGAYGAVAMIGVLDLMVLVPLSDLYLMPSKR